jgi:hypothetical protein
MVGLAVSGEVVWKVARRAVAINPVAGGRKGFGVEETRNGGNEASPRVYVQPSSGRWESLTWMYVLLTSIAVIVPVNDKKVPLRL